jgi:restriction endonuclease Mrr
MLATKYFYDHENLEQFRTEYEELPPHQKLMENPPLAVGSVLAVVLVVVMALTSAGII